MGEISTGPDDAPTRILLVDDSELNREIIGAMLTRAGFAVDVASDGETAWELTWSRRYDLVLMDLEMPGMSGFEAAARIRAREGVMSGVPIAALTATHMPDAELFSLWSGIDAFIAKPVLPTILVDRIEAILADRQGAGDDDWKPVWRLHAFADWARDLDETATSSCLADLLALMDEIGASIHVHATGSDRFLRNLDRLRASAARYGFDEIEGLCSLYDAPQARGMRSRDPNLLGAIGRARYAIEVWRQEHATAPPLGVPARAKVSVKSLFGGRQAA